MTKTATAVLGICGLTSLALWASIPAVGPLRGLPLLAYLPRYFAAFAIYLGAIVILFRSLPHASKTPGAKQTGHTLALVIIWLFANLFRLPLLTRPPNFSDDVYRYIWDGRVQNAGVNPYAHRVDSPALDYLATPNRALINNPNMASPYLPVAQVMFATVYRLAPESATAFQAAAMVFDLLTGLLLMFTLKQLGRPPEWSLIYLWNPLVVVEFAHGAHVDALMTMLMMAGLLATLGKRPLRVTDDRRSSVVIRAEWLSFFSPVFFGLATLVKPIPALLLPLLAPRWGWKRTALYGATVLIGLLPYAGAGLGLTGDITAGTGLFGATRIYLAWWNFNGGLYHWLEVLVTGYQTEGAVPIDTPGVELAKTISRVTLLAILALVFWRELKRVRAGRDYAPPSWLLPIAAYLLLAPTVHPWYLIPLAALLPLTVEDSPSPRRLIALLAWLYFCASVALSYLTYFNPNDFRETELTRRWEYLPLYALLILAALWPRRTAVRSAEP